MIVTLATQIIFRGISEVTLGAGGSIAITNTDGFRAIGGKVGNVPYILFLVLILGVIFAIFLGKSTFGRRTYAIGTNRVAAYYAGVHVEKIRFIIYTIMGLMSGLCAVFLVSSSYGANTTTGNGFEIGCHRNGSIRRYLLHEVVKETWPVVSFPLFIIGIAYELDLDRRT